MTVNVDLRNGLARVSFGSGRRANALTTETRHGLRSGLERLAADPDVRAVLLQGRGGHFCAGQDLAQHSERLAEGPDAIGGMVRREFSPIIAAIAAMPKPVIALLEGAVAGAGLGLALACDLRIAAGTARLGTAFAGVALGPDSGVSWFLPRLVGRATALDLLLRPRMVEAPEALELGLVHEVVEPAELAERGDAMGEELAQGPTIAYGAIKATLEASDGDLARSLEAEGDWQTVAAASHDHRAAVDAFIAKQRPVFRGE